MTTQLEQSLIADIPRLTADEQSALRFVLDRILVVGRRDYAPWQAEGDRRNMEAEIADELADAIVYTGMRAVMRAVRKRDRIEAFIAAAELAEMSPVPPVDCDTDAGGCACGDLHVGGLLNVSSTASRSPSLPQANAEEAGPAGG